MAEDDNCPVQLPNPPSLIESGDMRFLIFDAPSDDNLEIYAKVFTHYNVKVVVRVCDPTYSLETLQELGFETCDWPYNDGAAPPKDVINNWLSLCKKVFKSAPNENGVKPTAGIHCVAGLGRAPILVSIALIESGMDAIAAINLIRSKRKGAINRTQLQFLKKYKRSGGRCSIQ